MLKKRLWGIMTLITGVMLVFSFAACDTGGGDGGEIPPEQLPEAQRWDKWVDPKSTATLDYSVDPDDGVCTITVRGTPEEHNEIDGWYAYKAAARYRYTAKANTRYTYVFEAWTESDMRVLHLQYYWDDDDQLSLGFDIPLTSARKTYIRTGQVIPKNKAGRLDFQCADQLGTFYVKIISITENTGVPKTITITGIPEKTVHAVLRVSDDDLYDDGAVAVSHWGIISGNSVLFNLNEPSTGDLWFGSGYYYLIIDYLSEDKDEWGPWYFYTNGTGTRQKYNITSATSTIPFNKFTYFFDLEE
ncbi:MAG: hypothetical protein LBB89_04460 [Treponema sp.]|jgi:hypothetical protein|nr:hypothetical protein [Treponema sp.]